VKPKLFIPTQTGAYNRMILDRLKFSGMFEVVIDRSIPTLKHNMRLRRNFTVCKLFGVSFGLDTFELTPPTTDQHDIFKDLSVIFKSSSRNNTDLYQETEDRYNLKVLNYPLFHYDELFKYESTFKWQDSTKKYPFFFSGRIGRRRNRNKWKTYLEQSGLWKDFSGPDWGDEFQSMTRNVKWGLVLRGLGGSGDVKNRRTIFYASCGYPLVLNFKPEYHIPFAPNQDYILIDGIDDIPSLEHINPVPYARQSRRFYNKCLSPKANAEYIISVIKNIKESKWNSR